MLELLDSLLAFSAVMLGISLIVTVIVEGITKFVNLRGQALSEGLSTLFEQTKMTREQADELATKILTHPLISDMRPLRRGEKPTFLLATAIRKEELERLLADAKALGLELSDEVRDRIGHALGIVREWFDGQMDRVSQTFVRKARLLTIFVSFFVAFALHLDAAVILERMGSDSEVRAKLVARAEELAKTRSELDALRKELAASGFELLPKFSAPVNPERGIHSPFDYLDLATAGRWRHLLGITAAAALISLGAPFWFNLLKQLANLKTIVATKEEKERTQPKREASG